MGSTDIIIEHESGMVLWLVLNTSGIMASRYYG